MNLYKTYEIKVIESINPKNGKKSIVYRRSIKRKNINENFPEQINILLKNPLEKKTETIENSEIIKRIWENLTEIFSDNLKTKGIMIFEEIEKENGECEIKISFKFSNEQVKTLYASESFNQLYQKIVNDSVLSLNTQTSLTPN